MEQYLALRSQLEIGKREQIYRNYYINWNISLYYYTSYII